jgi:chlorobactene glucosyltransferase
VSVRAAVLASIPWIGFPLVGLWRSRPNRQLNDSSPLPPADPPLISAIVPARNEVHNIEKCARSILGTDYPALELIIVDDHSTDGTGARAQAIAAADPRVRVVTPPPLPEGWFGKQWACTTGAEAARGEILCFFDADTHQAPDFLPRAANLMRETRADMFTAMGVQEMGSFWERIIQPQVFSMMIIRYGGTERMNRSRHVEEKIANGQCILITRVAYDEMGGHAAVRQFVAEDMALAQRFFRAGKLVIAVLAESSFATRMYTSLRELIQGWTKNMFVAGFDAMPGGRIGRKIYPYIMLTPAVMGLLPPLGLLAGVSGIASPSVRLWGVISSSAMLLWWLGIYHGMRGPRRYALLYPLGAAALFYILARSLVSGTRVRWKDRKYIADPTRP